MEMNVNTGTLENVAIDKKELSASFFDLFSNCGYPMDSTRLASAIQDAFPAFYWLWNTSASAAGRAAFNKMHVRHNGDGKFEMDIPNTRIWTEVPESTDNECCFLPFDFAKCKGTFPLNIFCLKDCDPVFDEFVYRDLNVTRNEAIPGISSPGESFEVVNDRINKLSFAFYTNRTVLMGMKDTYTPTTKPFHGLLEIMNNAAVIAVPSTNIINDFAQVGCRLRVLGDTAQYAFLVHPLIYDSIDAAIVKGQFGEYPAGWSKDNGLRYLGIPFIADKNMILDFDEGVGEVWLVDGSTTGVLLATDLLVNDRFIKKGGIDVSGDKCGSECKYYFNYGGVFASDYNRLAKIVDVPIQSACTDVLGDLKGIISPQTLIPKGGESE